MGNHQFVVKHETNFIGWTAVIADKWTTNATNNFLICVLVAEIALV